MNIHVPRWLIILGIFVLLIVGSIAAVYVAVALDWLTLPAESLTTDDAREQVTDLTRMYNELDSLVVNLGGYDAEIEAIEARNAGYEDQSQWSTQDRSEWEQWVGQRIEARKEYNRRCGDYNAKWDNFFESGAARLYGLDDQIPERCEKISLTD